MRRLLPLLLFALAIAAGVAGGKALKPDETSECMDDMPCPKQAEKSAKDPETASAFADLNRQFVVPLIRENRVNALVVASLAIEVDDGSTEAVFAAEPKLRDAFLQVLFVHAHSGGFDGAFTAGQSVRDLRARLREVAEPVIGDSLKNVLITEIVRQDF